MPKITDHPKSRTLTQKQSDERRGIKPKTFKLPADIVALLEQLASSTDTPQNKIVAEGIKLWASQQDC